MALKYWVEFFEDLEHVRGRSRNTIMAYRRDLELYDKFLMDNKSLKLFASYLIKNGLSARSQARVFSSLRTYFKYCQNQGDLVPDLNLIKPPKFSTPLPNTLSIDEFEKLQKSCVVESKFKTARNHMTLLLLFGLGCRVSELIQLNLNDFFEGEGWLKVLGKGNKERIIPVTEPLMLELVAYLKEIRPNLAKKNEKSILINDRGNRPSRVDIWRWLDAWSKLAGFDKTVNPHKFRHGCATALLEAGADLRSIQVLLGHSSIQTTQIYTSVSTKHLESEIKKHHPLSGLD